MTVSRLLTYILFLGALPLLGSCSSDDAGDRPSAQTKATFTISARADERAADNELIHDWFIAFADASGKVCRTLRRYAGDAPLTPSPVDMDEFSTILAPGTYTVYSFANIDPADLGLAFTEGEMVPQGASAMPWTGDVARWTSADLIPMSGLQTVTVTSQVTQPFAVEVVRLVAKMELSFSNATGNPITVNQLWMRPMGKGNVNLFPDYALLGSRPALRADADTVTVGRVLDAVLQPMTDRAASHTFYTLESDAGLSHATGHYALLLDLTHGSGAGAVRDTVAMLTPELTYINRNDHILLPVRLADYILKMDVRFYPPIGGYPAVVNEMKGNDYYIRFGTQGAFAITPMMREAAPGASWMQPSQLDIEILSVSGDPIFISAPAYDSATGEITGELSSSKGKAAVVVAVGAKGSNLSYQRTIYIIREDKK